MITDAPLIYFNIGWMSAYAGHANDPISGGHQYLAHNKVGGESFNFLADADGVVRGCRPGSDKGLRIERLDLGAKSADYLDGVTVVWMAREPRGGRTLIVGWYLNARVYRSATPAPVPRFLPNGGVVPVTAETRAADAVLLPAEARNFQIASRRTSEIGFGQSPTWYGDESVDARVRAYIAGARKRLDQSKGRGGAGRQTDPDKRKTVEQAAVDHAWAYFESDAGGACQVVTVETEAKGWDLEAAGSDRTWLVEVKGLSGARLTCEVTANEYRAMRNAAHRRSYILYVVCNVLDGPIASIFRWSAGTWRTEDGRTLKITEKTAAVLSCS